jgi:hypothetical protein
VAVSSKSMFWISNELTNQLLLTHEIHLKVISYNDKQFWKIWHEKLIPSEITSIGYNCIGFIVILLNILKVLLVTLFLHRTNKVFS